MFSTHLFFNMSNEFKMVSGLCGPTCNLCLRSGGLEAQLSAQGGETKVKEGGNGQQRPPEEVAARAVPRLPLPTLDPSACHSSSSLWRQQKGGSPCVPGSTARVTREGKQGPRPGKEAMHAGRKDLAST